MAEGNGSPNRVSIELRSDLVRSDLVKGHVWFVNYAAIDPTAVNAASLDLHGAAMLPQDVELFAHRWLAIGASVDVQHDGRGRPVGVLESFFNSDQVRAGAWPRNAHAVRLDVSRSSEILTGLRAGTLNCVSLDAFTWNKVQRLPVAQAAKAAPGGQPANLAQLATELAAAGYDEVTGARLVGNVYVVTRKQGLPLAVQFKEDTLEVDAFSGAAETLFATLMTNPTVTIRDIPNDPGPGEFAPVTPPSAGAVDTLQPGPWDEAHIRKLLTECGITLGEGFQPWVFVRQLAAAGLKLPGVS